MKTLAVLVAAGALVAAAQAAPAETVRGARTAVLKPSGIPVTLLVSTTRISSNRLAVWVTLRDGRATPGRLIKRLRTPLDGFPKSSRLVSITVRPSTAKNTALFSVSYHVSPSVGTIRLTYAATATSLTGPLD